jgi:hypothetical protein
MPGCNTIRSEHPSISASIVVVEALRHGTNFHERVRVQVDEGSAECRE